SHGIVFIDEVDKIRANVGAQPSVRGIVAQEALLTLMENENVEFDVDGKTLSVNSSNILFVAGGAFEELYDNVLRRAMIGQDAARQKRLGARALRETFRRVIRALEFDPTEGGGVVTIDEEMVQKAMGKR